MKIQLLPKLPKKGEKRPPTPGARRLAVLLAVNVVLALLLYYLVPVLLPAGSFPYMSVLYLAAGAALAIWYVVYNRGFRTRGKSPADLPDNLPLTEREQMIADGERRMRQSRWALTILIPIIVTFLFDMIYLFLIPEGWIPEGLFS